MMTRRETIFIVTLALAGTLFKGAGWILYGSKTLMVDTLTCIANLLALTGVLYYQPYTTKPPDQRHMYGHHRLSLTGLYITIITYSAIAGFSAAELLSTQNHGLEPGALPAAVAGTLAYTPIVAYSLRKGGMIGVYGLFTTSELLEGLTAITAVALGLEVDPRIDLLGGAAILAFILYEIIDASRDYLRSTSDTAPPTPILDKLQQDITRLGVNVKSLRVRCITPGVYQGDIVITLPPSLGLVKAHELTEKIEQTARKHGVELVVHVEPSEE